MLQYILECIAFQLVFLIIYDVFLKRETFFQWNRLYLISTYIISMVLPWVKIEAMKTTVPESFQAYPEFLWSMNNSAVVTATIQEPAFSISWEYALLFGGMLLSALFFGYKLYQIYALRQKGEVQYFKDFTRIIIANSSMAFSFFKSIFLGDKVIEKEHENILQHELVHIRQRHSYDLIFFELMRIVGWFNPLVYVYQRRVSELHEFIADDHVAKTHKKEQYQLLLSEVFQTQHISFINQFFKSSLIKKRIVMLSKEKSKKIFQLKYLLLLPLVFGMLAYTSIESSIDDVIVNSQTTEDEKLIDEINAELEEEVAREGMLGKVFYAFSKASKTKGDTYIFTKKEYFKEQLLFRLFFENMNPVEFGDDVRTSDPMPTWTLPSTSRYESYVSRKEAFYILDENLQFSIKAYDQHVGLIETKPSYPNQSFLFEVANVKDLTGAELRSFNNKLAEIFEGNETIYSDLILTDGEYAFRVYTSLKKGNLINYDSMAIEGLVERSDKKVVLNVFDIKQLSRGEKAKKEKLQNELRNSNTIDTLLVTDGKYSTETISNGNNGFEINVGKQSDPEPFATVDEVPVFPGCEDASNKRACFNENMQRHIAKNFNYPKEAQEKGIQGRVSVMFIITKKGKIEGLRMRGPDSILEKEVERIIGRLPKMKPGKHKGKKVDVPFSIPITFKLNSYGPDYEILPEIGASDGDVVKSIRQYNQLVAERNRLLQSSNKTNPIIVNLDQQLEAIKTKIQQSDTSQKGLEEQFLLILKERENSKINQSQLETEDVPFSTVENVPVFPGCEDAANKRACFNEKMQKHIGQNFRYPQEAQEKGIQGRVSIMFTVSKEGAIQNLRMRGPDKILEKEAARIIGRLPKMTPGKHKNKSVNVPFSIPITFKLQGKQEKLDRVQVSNFKEPYPLILIDGVESFNNELLTQEPTGYESVNVLKGGAATIKYGDKGKNGVIEITTKKHKVGDSEKVISKGSAVGRLVVIDGKESSNKDLNEIEKEYVGFFNSEYGLEKYGEKGKNGVTEVLTKEFFNSNPKLAQVHKQITELRKERSRLLKKATDENSILDDNPIIKQLDTQIDVLQKEQDKLVNGQLKKN